MSQLLIGNLFVKRHLHSLVGGVLSHNLLPSEFKSRHAHIWSVFHLRLHFITIGGCSFHLAYHVHKGGRKIPVILFVKMLTELDLPNNMYCCLLSARCKHIWMFSWQAKVVLFNVWLYGVQKIAREESWLIVHLEAPLYHMGYIY